MEIGSGISPPESKRPRRSVQSKLSWYKPPPTEEPVAAAAAMAMEDTEREGKGRRKRKSPPKTPSKSPAKDKEGRSATRKKNCQKSSMQSSETTPQKSTRQTSESTPQKATSSRDSEQNGSCLKKRLTFRKSNTIKDIDIQNAGVKVQMPDLLLEAKKAAEENARLSAGKQTHPFFTSLKLGKKLSVTPEKEKSKSLCWSCLDEDYFASYPPLHVFEKLGDETSSLDWGNWTFIETTPVPVNGFCTTGNTYSGFKDSNEPLKSNNISQNTLDLNQTYDQVEGCMSPANSSYVFSNERDTSGQLLTTLDEVHASSKSPLPSRCLSYVGYLESQLQDKLLRERLASYRERIGFWPEGSLWTDKYQPKNSIEVCGNIEPVKSLNEWLKSWNQKGSRTVAKINILEQSAIEDAEESEGSTYVDESDMDDLDTGDTMKNVLLITGPVGSGKSAAIYACAREQGFEIIEVNASDLRSGTHVRQKFGEATESHRLNQRSVEDPSDKRIQISKLLVRPVDVREEEFKNDSHEIALMTSKHDLTPTKSSCGARGSCQAANKTLILFEDVDTVFDEDRGLISSILQLAETSKRPIILTSNNNNPVLPQLLYQFVLTFTLPSSDELLCHLYMICACEKAHISLELLKHLIKSCFGDIRKILMLLQFWCQARNSHIDRNLKGNCYPLPFDIDTAHLIMPRTVPWGAPCKLSEKIGNEIDKILTIEEDKICNMEVEPQDLAMKKNAPTPIKARKKTLSKKNCASVDFTEFLDDANGLEDFSADLYSLENTACRKFKHRTGFVLSSLSDDGSTDCLPRSDFGEECYTSNMATATISQIPNIIDCSDSSTDPAHNVNRGPWETVEAEPASASRICETFLSQDVSSVPESYFMSETKPEKMKVLSPKDVSCGLVDSITMPTNVHAGEVNNTVRPLFDLNKCIDAENICDTDVESVSGNEELGHSQNKDDEPLSSGYHLMDECSQAEISTRKVIKGNCECLTQVDLVQETWRKMRRSRDDLKSCLPSNIQDVTSLVKAASRLTDLISEADIMFGSCYPLLNDLLDPSLAYILEPDDFKWYEGQCDMGSTYAQLGVCLYTSKCATVGSSLGHENIADFAQEMLFSSNSTMALGKLLSMGKMTQNPYNEDSDIQKSVCRAFKGREVRSALHDIILPTVPTRLSTSLKGHAFHEYSSFMSKISKLERYRLSQSTEKRKRRAGRHYFSSGALSLSPEHMEALAQSCNFKS